MWIAIFLFAGTKYYHLSRAKSQGEAKVNAIAVLKNTGFPELKVKSKRVASFLYVCEYKGNDIWKDVLVKYKPVYDIAHYYKSRQVQCRWCKHYEYIDTRSEGEPSYNTLDKTVEPEHFCNKRQVFIDQAAVDRVNREWAHMVVKESNYFRPIKVLSEEIGEDGQPIELEKEGWFSNKIWAEMIDPRREVENELWAVATYCSDFKGKRPPMSKKDFKARLLRK